MNYAPGLESFSFREIIYGNETVTTNTGMAEWIMHPFNKVSRRLLPPHFTIETEHTALQL